MYTTKRQFIFKKTIYKLFKKNITTSTSIILYIKKPYPHISKQT